MDNQLLQTLVEEDYGYKREGRNWGRAEEHSSLVVNEEQQKWFWNSENMGGDVLSYLIKVRGLSKKSALEIIEIREKIVNGTEIEEIDRPKQGKPYEKLVDLLWLVGRDNRQYWYDRKLRDNTIDRYRLGFYSGWYTIPLYIEGRFVNFQCRRDEPEKRIKMWYKIEGWKPVLINPEILTISDSIFITEGAVDSILLNQEGIAAVSHTGGAGYWNPAWYPLFANLKSIYYIPDNDSAGHVGAYKVSQALGVDKVKIYMFKGKKEKYDTGDYFKEGGNAKDFRTMVENESLYAFEIGEINDIYTKRKSSSVLRSYHKRYKA